MCLNFQIGNHQQKVQPYTCKYGIFNYIKFFRIFHVFTFCVANNYTLYILVDCASIMKPATLNATGQISILQHKVGRNYRHKDLFTDLYHMGKSLEVQV
jgi:hypothetical protein